MLFNNFLAILDTCLSCEDMAQQSCVMVHRWQIFGDFFASCIPVSCVKHVSDLHPKFALGPHHVASNLRRLRIGKEKKKMEDR